MTFLSHALTRRCRAYLTDTEGLMSRLHGCRGATSPDATVLLCRYSYPGEGLWQKLVFVSIKQEMFYATPSPLPFFKMGDEHGRSSVERGQEAQNSARPKVPGRADEGMRLQRVYCILLFIFKLFYCINRQTGHFCNFF